MNNIFGEDLFGDPIKQKPSGIIAEKFIIPPFSILDTRQQAWRERKNAWLSIGIKGELGRDAKTFKIHKWMEEKGGGKRNDGDGTSIFDPVLCELVYTWFCPKGGKILDPFAGGSVRGIVSSYLGYRYWGCDLNTQQIESNYSQFQNILINNPGISTPVWINGDSEKELDSAEESDLIFSCPPYGNLEKYTDLEEDLSNMDYEQFNVKYDSIIKKSILKLKNNRFAIFVVQDFRDKNGFYNTLCKDTIDIFHKNRVFLYNKAILINSCGSLPIRISSQFENSKKLGMMHQEVLIFYKGNIKTIFN